jgi:riboflavin kinase
LAYTRTNVLRLLIVLGKQGAIERPTIIRTTELKNDLNVSQQTISRWLEDLKELSYISKEQTSQGLKIKITEKGSHEILLPAFNDLKTIFQVIQTTPNQIRGELVKGLGEGGYYISLPGYNRQFKQILGYEPFPGTLNLRLRTELDKNAFKQLLKSKSFIIKGFQYGDRSVGKVFLWLCDIQYHNQFVKGAVIYPDRTHHTSMQIVELISLYDLRKRLSLHDGDTVVIKF